MYTFKSSKTQNAFNAWLKWLDGGTTHSCDMKEFFKFVQVCYDNGERISKEQFCALVKTRIHTSRTHNYGVVQKLYFQFDTIIQYLKAKQERFK